MTETLRRPQHIGPSPEVVKAIRAEMKRRKLTVHDRRMAGVSATLGAEPFGRPGFNEGIFYPEAAVPERVARLAPSRAVRSRPTTGTLRLLVLLVDFSDNQGARSADNFKEMLFSQETYRTGSMRDFYRENSYGQLDVDGDVLGWLRLPQPYSYYVNGQNGGDDTNYPHNAKKMVEDALAIAARSVDFRQFDPDGDGFVDGLFVVHAGGGAEADPNPETPHRRSGRISGTSRSLSSPTGSRLTRI